MAGEAGDGFGALLKRHRLAAGLTQEGLAERSGISARAVSDLERDGADWEAAERLASAGCTEERADIGFRAYALGHLASLAQLRGDAERAWWAVREVLPAGTATEPGTVAFVDWAMASQRVAAALALDEGDLPSANEWLEAHDRWLAWSEAVPGRSHGQVLWAQYYRQMGDASRARAHAEQALAHAEEPRQPLALLAACSAHSTPRRAGMMTRLAISMRAPPPTSGR